MTAKTPPIPAENRSPKGPGGESHSETDEKNATAVGNTDKQGQQGNAHINTTHQGHQQDR